MPKSLSDRISRGPRGRLLQSLSPPVPVRKVLTSSTLRFRFYSERFYFQSRITQPTTLAERISPYRALPSIDFRKKTSEEVIGILDKKVNATIERYQAIFDKKHLFDKLPSDHQTALHRLADQLNWVSDHLGEADSWTKEKREQVSWVCKSIGKVEFTTKEESLAKRYRKVAKDLAFIANGGYLDWIVL